LSKEEKSKVLENKERLENLQSQLTEVVEKRGIAQNQLNDLTTLGLKLQGAIEILESIENENKGENK
jgi:hypothetical protein